MLYIIFPKPDRKNQIRLFHEQLSYFFTTDTYCGSKMYTIKFSIEYAIYTPFNHVVELTHSRNFDNVLLKILFFYKALQQISIRETVTQNVRSLLHCSSLQVKYYPMVRITKKKKKEADADLTSEVGLSCHIKHQKPSTNGRYQRLRQNVS